MPVLFKEFLHNGSIVGVWQVTESVEELYGKIKLTQEEEQIFDRYKHENRKKLWLSYRALIHDIIDDNFKISYSDFGKPFLELFRKKQAHIHFTFRRLFGRHNQ